MNENVKTKKFKTHLLWFYLIIIRGNFSSSKSRGCDIVNPTRKTCALDVSLNIFDGSMATVIASIINKWLIWKRFSASLEIWWIMFFHVVLAPNWRLDRKRSKNNFGYIWSVIGRMLVVYIRICERRIVTIKYPYYLER